LDETKTSTRDFCGSLGYIAPEIYQRKSYRYEVDMFAFGVLLFRLLSNERPFPSHNQEILQRHTIELRYNVQGRDWETVSDSAKDLVRRLLINRQERWTAQECIQHEWFSQQGTSILRLDKTKTSIIIGDEHDNGHGGGGEDSRSGAFVLVRPYCCCCCCCLLGCCHFGWYFSFLNLVCTLYKSKYVLYYLERLIGLLYALIDNNV
jgi:serine/threonine protein kinase